MTDHVIRTTADRDRLVSFLASLDLSKPRKIAITEIRSQRSDAQNRLLWMWNNAIQKHLADSFGQFASAQEWHEILVARLWPCEVRKVAMPGPAGGEFKVGRAKTSGFTQAQMAEYLDLLDRYCAEHLQLLLPQPEDLMLAIYAQRRRVA